MAGNSNQNGVLNGAASLRDPEASVGLLIQAVEEFMAEMERVTTPDPTTGRARFPDFVVQPEIRDKITSAMEELGRCNIKGAWDVFSRARIHFNNQQAAFARVRLLNGLVNEYDLAAEKGCDEDLLGQINRAVKAYKELVASFRDDGTREPFDLTGASHLYWITYDTIESARKEFHGRRRARQAQAAHEALQTACSSGEQRLRLLFTSQSAVLNPRENKTR